MYFNEFKHHIRTLESLLSNKNKDLNSSDSTLINLIKDMAEVYIQQKYPLDWTLYELSQQDGIPEGAEVIERREHQPIEFKRLARKKGIKEEVPFFTSLTLRHPNWERTEIDLLTPEYEFTFNTLLKWEYPSKVIAYAEYLNSLPFVSFNSSL